MKESLSGAATGLLKKLLGSLPSPGGGPRPDANGPQAPIAPTPEMGPAPQMAAGGPVMPGRFYEWQERASGREYFVSGSPGEVVNPASGQRPVTQKIVFNITTPDAGSFHRSSGQIQAAARAWMAKAARNS